MRMFFSLFALASTAALLANPEGFHSIAGEATCKPIDLNTLEISIKSNAILEWQSFSIDAHETTRFIMPDQTYSVLNRVMGGKISEILGTLDSNGQIFLINSQGVLIGENAKVNTTSFIASSFDILNQDFLEGNYRFCYADAGSIINLGNINSNEVHLVGHEITNHGTINALKTEKKNGRIFLLGNNTTDNSGVIKAPGGEVRLLAKNVALNEGAKVDVSDISFAGTILIGGDYQGNNPEIPNADYLFVHNKAEISADSYLDGDGGKVILWGNKGTYFYGQINAKGGSQEGNGGFIEVSSGEFLGYHGISNATAPNGFVGELLLDPPSLVISNASTSGNVEFGMPECPTFSFCIANSNDGILNAEDVQDQLSISKVTIRSRDDLTLAPGVGIYWSSGNDLSFIAQGNIRIHGNIDGNGDITIQGGKVSIQNTGNSIPKAPIVISGESLTLVSTEKDINIRADNDVLTAILLQSSSFINVTSARDFNIFAGAGTLGFISIGIATGTSGCIDNPYAMNFSIARDWNINQGSMPPGFGSFVSFTFNGAEFIANVANDIVWTGGQTFQQNSLNFIENSFTDITAASTTMNGVITNLPCEQTPPPPPPPPPPPTPSGP